MKWILYVPAETDPFGLGGHYDLGDHATKQDARAAACRMFKRKRLPAGSAITKQSEWTS